MRFIILIISIFINYTTLTSQQIETRIDSLLMEAKAISEHVDQLNFELDSINGILKLLKYQKQQKEELRLANEGIKTITNSVVNLKYGPSPLDDRITTIPANVEITVHAVKSNYYKVKYNDMFGWVHLSFLEEVEQLNEFRKNFKSNSNYSSNVPTSSYSTNPSSNSKSNYKFKNKSGTWVKGHYRKVNGKKVWVRGHYRKY